MNMNSPLTNNISDCFLIVWTRNQDFIMKSKKLRFLSHLYDFFVVIVVFHYIDGLFDIPKYKIAMAVICLCLVSTP